ncbi:MAG: BrnA antitoxin family protein [Vulcanimicrobiaceae bacterium]|jgi:uncharacterized protein (DUF4415 family)
MAKAPKRRAKTSTPNRKIDFSGGRRGSVLPQEGKTRITMWIDTEVLDWFRARADREGRGYQTAMNEALNTFAGGDHRPLSEIVRDVVRAELRAALKAG